MRTSRLFVILASLLVSALALWLVLSFFAEDLGTADLRFVHSGSAEDHQFWQEAIADFQKVTGIRVRHDFITNESDPYSTRLREVWTGESSPNVALMPVATFTELASELDVLQFPGVESANAGTAVADSTTSIGPPFESTGLKAFAYDGEQRGLPFAGSNLLIYLNTKAFEKASAFHGKAVEIPGDDWSITQFLRTAEMLTCDFDRDGITDQYGFWLPGWGSYLPFIWSFGADLTNEAATEWTFSGSTAQTVMRFYRQLATGDRVVPRGTDWPGLEQDTGFLAGKTAMCVSGPAFASILDRSKLALHYRVAPIPRGTGGRATRITWEGLVVRKNLEPARRVRAIRFVEYALSKPVQDRLASSGRALPARNDALPNFVAPDPPRRRPFVDALAYSRLQAPLPGLETLDLAISRHFGEAVNPETAFEAPAMLDALARDPAVVSAFSKSPSAGP